MKYNTTSRTYSFDSGHRVLYNSDGCGHRGKCANLHGHTYLLKVTFAYKESTIGDTIGYAVDFGEIKRVFIDFIDTYLDHGFIANPREPMLDALKKDNSRLYIMSLGNPSAENIAKELFFIGEFLMKDHGLDMFEIELNETPKCSVNCTGLNMDERILLYDNRNLMKTLSEWKESKGIRSHDIRKNPIMKSEPIHIPPSPEQHPAATKTCTTNILEYNKINGNHYTREQILNNPANKNKEKENER